MASRLRLRYGTRLFLGLTAMLWLLIGCFVGFQYNRERQMKALVLDSQLQLLNRQAAANLLAGESPETLYAANRNFFDGLRMTLIDPRGVVLYDSYEGDRISSMPNHSNRPEVRAAMQKGSGYAIKRHSQSLNSDYFYSATKFDGGVVRCAIPYTSNLISLLNPDKHFLWFVLAFGIITTIVARLITKRLGATIIRLEEFAEQANRGEEIGGEYRFPKNELGEISSHIVDIYTKLRHTTAQLQLEHAAALRQEREKERIKRELTNNINHELKTPLCSLLGYLEMALDGRDNNPEQKMEYVRKGFSQALRLRSLNSDISILSQMDESDGSVAKSELSLNGLIGRIVDDVAVAAREQNIKVELSLDDNMVISGNESMLYSVFRNLLDNAIAYSGCRRITISSHKQTATHYHFTFADNGIGVDPQHIEHLFERFYRVDKGRSRKMGGTGLGLAIVKNALLLHSGQISVENGRLGGLVFQFSIAKK